MKNRTTTSLLSAAAIALSANVLSSQAAYSPTVGNEIVVFQDNFNDNSNGWSNIGGGTTQATIGLDPGGTGESVWYPSIDSDGGSVSSSTSITAQALGSFPPADDVSPAPLAIYMRVRVDANSGDANRFRITLGENGSNRFGELLIRPAQTGFLNYRLSTGDGANTPIAGTSYTGIPNQFIDFRLLLTNNQDGSMTLDAFRNDGGTYTLLGSYNAGDLETSLFDELQINQRNGTTANSRVYFDSVMVTRVIPEPTTIALLGLAGPLALRRRRV